LIIRFSLLLVLGAIASFLLAAVLYRLTITNLADQASQLGSMVLLCAFFLLLLAGAGLTGKLITAAFCDYFSARQCMERRLLFYVGRINRLNQLCHLKKIRLLYFNQQKRKHLLNKYNRKSVVP
jgi:hypothetical protein